MRQTWRWFGPKDIVAVDDMLQAGVEGVVSALHHVPNGIVWTPEEIAKRQREIGTRRDGSPSGLAWEVVESVPPSEDIKKQTGDWKAHLEAYRQTLRNLAAAGHRGRLLQLHAGARLDPHRHRLAARPRRHLHALRPPRLRRLRHPHPAPPRRDGGLPAPSWSRPPPALRRRWTRRAKTQLGTNVGFGLPAPTTAGPLRRGARRSSASTRRCRRDAAQAPDRLPRRGRARPPRRSASGSAATPTTRPSRCSGCRG